MLILAYNIRCVLGIYMFKIEVLDLGKAWRRPGRASLRILPNIIIDLTLYI